MRILVLGGTRFIGLAIVRALAAAGHDVAVFHRGSTPAELPPGVQEFLGDRGKLSEHAETLRDWQPDIVVDMLAFTEADTASVLDAFSGHAQRLVVISSCDVYRAYGVLLGLEQGVQDCPLGEDAVLRSRLYPFRGEQPRAADDPRRFLDDYDKILVERAVLGQSALPATVLRLPMVYGPRDPQRRMFPYLKRIADGRPGIVLSATDAQRRFARGFVDNVGAACALAAAHPDAGGRVFNVADEPQLTELQWVSAIAAACGWDGRITVVPDDELPVALRPERATPQELAVDSAAIRALGFSEPVPLDRAVALTAAWERANMPRAVRPVAVQLRS